MKEKRIEIVKRVLGRYRDTRSNQKLLVIKVWEEELGDMCFCAMHVQLYCSNPSGILRDRRRKEVLELYPRGTQDYEHFQGYVDEFGKPTMFNFN